MTAFLNWLESSSAPHSAFPCKSWADRATSLRCWRKSRSIVSSRRVIRAVRSFPRGGEGKLPQNLQRINWTLVKREMADILKERRNELKVMKRRSGKNGK